MENNKITELPEKYCVYAETLEQAKIIIKKQIELFGVELKAFHKYWYRFTPNKRNDKCGCASENYTTNLLLLHDYQIGVSLTFDEWNKLIKMPKYTVDYCLENNIAIEVKSETDYKRVMDILKENGFSGLNGVPYIPRDRYIISKEDKKEFYYPYNSIIYNSPEIISASQFIKDNTEMKKRDLKAGDYVYIEYDRSEDSKMFNRQVKKVTRVHSHALEVEGGQGGIHFDEVRLATKEEIESMTGKKIIGYKAPYDINDFIKKDDLMVDAELLTRKDFVKKGQTGNGSHYYLSSELVKSIFIPVYEEVIKSKSVKIGNGSRTITIYNDGRIEGEKTYSIQNWLDVINSLTGIFLRQKNGSKSFDLKVQTVKIGCEENVTLEQIFQIKDFYYELNPERK